MERFEVGALALAVALLTACGQKQDRQEAASPAPVASAPTQEPAKAGNPDFGGVTKLSREVEAVGSTQELAVLSALQSAVAQVNGVRVAGQLQSVRAGLDMSVNGQPAGSVRSEAFVQKVLAASQGAVTGFEILSQEETANRQTRRADHRPGSGQRWRLQLLGLGFHRRQGQR